MKIITEPCDEIYVLGNECDVDFDIGCVDIDVCVPDY